MLSLPLYGAVTNQLRSPPADDSLRTRICISAADLCSGRRYLSHKIASHDFLPLSFREILAQI